jgi:hypothetical protein
MQHSATGSLKQFAAVFEKRHRQENVTSSAQQARIQRFAAGGRVISGPDSSW